MDHQRLSIHAVNCERPQVRRNISSVIVMDYNSEGPAVLGTEVTFSCRPGFILLGPNSSTCRDSGQWEPGTKEVLCTGLLVIISMIS